MESGDGDVTCAAPRRLTFYGGPRALSLFLSPSSLAFRSQGEAFCERCRLQLEEKVLGLCLPLCLQQLHPLEHPADELLLLLDAQGVGLQRPLQLRIRI